MSAQTLSGIRTLVRRRLSALPGSPPGAPLPLPHRPRAPRRGRAPTARRSPQSGTAPGSAIYLTQPRGPSAGLGFDCRHLTAAEARRHEQFKRLSFFHGLGGEGRPRSRRLTADAPPPQPASLSRPPREDTKAGGEGARSKRDGRRREQRAPGCAGRERR